MPAPDAAAFPDVIEVVVEIPRGSRNKYEWDMAAGVFRLDRVLSSAVFYNFDYGFALDTTHGDGDPTDTLLLIDEPTFPGCHVQARPVGGLEDKATEVVGWLDVERAREVLNEDRERWRHGR